MANTILLWTTIASSARSSYLLRDAGPAVSTATNGMAARVLLRNAEEVPELILLDLMMPVMDGWHFRVEQLRDARLAHIPVIVLSAAGDVRREAMALGAAGYLTKPFKLAVGQSSSRGRRGCSGALIARSSTKTNPCVPDCTAWSRDYLAVKSAVIIPRR